MSAGANQGGEVQTSARLELSAFDLAPASEQGRPLELKHPATGEPLPGYVLHVRGYDSASYQAVLDEHQRRRIERLAKKERVTVEEIKVEALEAAAALVAGWEDRFDLDGKPLPYSSANALALLRRLAWIRPQVEQFAGARANFLPGSATR